MNAPTAPSPAAPLDVDAIEARANAATPGPWAWASTGEKCYGACVGSGVVAEADVDAEHPLSGNLSDRTDDYYVEQGVAEMSHQNCNADAAFIAAARSDVPALCHALRVERKHVDVLCARVRELEALQPALAELLAATDVPQGWRQGEPLDDRQFAWVKRVREARNAIDDARAALTPSPEKQP